MKIQSEVISARVTVDQLGRIVIPVGIRKKMQLAPGSILEFHYSDNENYVIRRARDKKLCTLCSSPNNLVEIPYQGHYVCRTCLRSLAKLEKD